MTTEPGGAPGPPRATSNSTGPKTRLRAYLPWWFLAGAAVSAALPIVVGTDVVATASVIMWGPAIGSVLRARRTTAEDLRKAGRSTFRRDLAGPGWREPVLAVVVLIGVSGTGLLLAGIWPDGQPSPHRQAYLVLGFGLLAVAAVAVSVMIEFARRHRKRIEAQRELASARTGAVTIPDSV